MAKRKWNAILLLYWQRYWDRAYIETWKALPANSEVQVIIWKKRTN